MDIWAFCGRGRSIDNGGVLRDRVAGFGWPGRGAGEMALFLSLSPCSGIRPLGSRPLGSHPLRSHPLKSNPLGSRPFGSRPLRLELVGTDEMVVATTVNDADADADDQVRISADLLR